MNKVIKRGAVVFAIVASAIYLTFSFGAWDFNPKNWDMFGRVICAVGIIFLTAMLTAISFNEDIE